MTNDHHDDDLLAAYDLSAWEAPPPQAGLADAVIARARQPASSTPLETIERMNPRGRRRWWFAGAGVAVAAVAILIGVWGMQRTPKDGQGEVTAQTARTLAIGPTTAALDPGTLVKWRRDKRQITVSQPRGSAMWNVDDSDTLVIDAGAMVASVEASGASLRVEVEMMNASDARAIGISAATAIAVALVTIVVYEGAVRVRHDGEVVTVAPGSRYEVRPPTATAEDFAVGAKPPPDPRVKELEDRIKELEGERTVAPTSCDEVSCVLTNYDGACCAKFKAQKPPAQPPCDADALRKKGDDQLQVGMDAAALAAFEASMKCREDEALNRRMLLAACRSKNARKAQLYYSKIPVRDQTALGQMCIRNGIPLTASEPCDADALRQKGDDHLQTGMDKAALIAFEEAMRCKPDPTLNRRIFLAACRAKNAAKARAYYPKIDTKDQAPLSQMCLRNGIDPTSTAPSAPSCQQPDAFDPMNDAPVCVGNGVIKVASKPAARVFIDGVDTGKTTPATFKVSAGRHKVTFQVKADKYTFAVTVKAGETITFSKTFE